MSENKKQLTPEELKAQLREEVRADPQKEYHGQIKDLNDQLAKAKKEAPSAEVEGEVSLKLEDASGKKKTVKVGIADGYPNIRPLKGQNFVIGSELFLKLAAGKVKDEDKLKYLTNNGCTQEKAVELLQELVTSESRMVKIIQ